MVVAKSDNQHDSFREIAEGQQNGGVYRKQKITFLTNWMLSFPWTFVYRSLELFLHVNDMVPLISIADISGRLPHLDHYPGRVLSLCPFYNRIFRRPRTRSDISPLALDLAQWKIIIAIGWHLAKLVRRRRAFQGIVWMEG